MKGENVFVDTNANAIASLKRFDLVLFKPFFSDTSFFIFRVIGMPGEILDINPKECLINRVEVSQYHPPEVLRNRAWTQTALPPSILNIDLGNDEFFVVGDNLNNANDSRFWGALNVRSIVGKVISKPSREENSTGQP